MTDQINGELVPADPRNSLSAPRPQQALLDLGPQAMVARASEIATVLKDIIEKQKLFTDIGGKRYVKVEAWTTMGSMIGFLPREKSVVEQNDGSFLATIELVDVRTGHAVGEGSALCGMDEARWKRADRYARRSMAITRATGKAYRSAFSWVMTLAGYEPTPEEEMPGSKRQAVDDEIPFGPEAEARLARAKQVKPPQDPAELIYENTLPEQTELAKQLAAWNVPDDLHEHVGARLKGRRRGDTRKVVEELMKEYQP